MNISKEERNVSLCGSQNSVENNVLTIKGQNISLDRIDAKNIKEIIIETELTSNTDITEKVKKLLKENKISLTLEKGAIVQEYAFLYATIKGAVTVKKRRARTRKFILRSQN